jgi:hypothetical protein
VRIKLPVTAVRIPADATETQRAERLAAHGIDTTRPHTAKPRPDGSVWVEQTLRLEDMAWEQ